MQSGRYKLLVIDIDGTLISQDGSIPTENRDAVTMVRDTGMQVSLSTGRSVQSSLHIINELGLDNHHIFFDGALVSRIELDEPVYIQNIDDEVVKELVEYGRSNDINLEFASVERYFSERETWSTDIKQRYFNIETTVGDLNGLWEREKIIRVDFVITEQGHETDARLLTDFFKDKLHFTQAYSPRFPDARFVNIIAPGISKGKSLEALASYLGITTEQVMAVGDWLNDITLLTSAGLGIAMGNAHDDLKKVADHITLDVEENGLAA